MAEQRAKAPAWVRAVVDYGGLVAWLVAFLVYARVQHVPTSEALVRATWWLVGGSAAGLALGYATERRIALMPLIAGGAALVFGGLTLIFHDPRFIKIKPTAMNLVLAAVMLGGVLLKKNPLKVLFADALVLSEPAWRKLTIRYGLFFAFMAVLNEVVWRTQPDSIWVPFRFPGLLILSVLFSLTQVPAMMKDMKAAEAAAELES